jgi:PAS domain S-box-containing protein
MGTTLNLPWLRSHSSIANLIRTMSWEDCSLGSPDQWPAALRTALNLILDSKFPAYIWWGPDNINLYNDAYVDLAGPSNHPRYFGQPAQKMWTEIWPTLTEFLSKVKNGESILYEDLQMPLERQGVKEEAYFTFTYGPARDETGEVQGVLCTCYETTQKISAEKEFKQEAHRAANASKILQDFFEQSPTPLCILMGPEHRYTMANRPYERLIGRKAIIGKSIWEVFQTEEIKPFIHLLDDIYNTGIPYHGSEALLPLPDEHGDLKDTWIDFSYHPFRDEGGVIQGILVNATDVTQKVKARKDVEKSVEEFQQLANFLPHIVWTTTPDGKINYANDVWVKYFGQSIFSDDEWAQRIHPEDVALVSERWWLAIEESKPFKAEMRLKDAFGNYRWFQSQSFPIKDQAGKVTRWIGTNTDIHETKSFTFQLESEAAKFETIFANSTTSMALLRGSDLIFEKANPSYMNLFNDRVKIGEPIRNIMPEIFDQVFGAQLQKVFYTGEAIRAEEAQAFLRRTDDSPLEERYFEQTYTQIKDANGNPYGVFIHAVDITKAVLSRRRLDALTRDLSEAVRTRDEFMSIASHELKTPLTSMKLQAQTIQRFISRGVADAISPERIEKFLKNNDKQVSRLNRLVDDMLDITRIQSGKLSINFEETDLHELIKDVYDHLHEQAANSNVDLRIQLNSHVTLFIDRARMEQVFTNLITNAVRYGLSRPVLITLDVVEGKALARIIDQGKGIPLADQARIFNRFERLVSASEISGLGLGLYISNEIVHSHGGQILVKSAPGEGSTFTVELPIG